jgi:hypothetical protein
MRERWRHTRRAALLTVAVGVLTSGLLTASRSHGPDSAAAPAFVAAGPASAAGGAGCAVRYQTQRDIDGVFDVNLTVTNTGSHPVPGWMLTFDFPGQQRILEGTGWTQAGRRVRSPAGMAPLAPDASVTLQMTGTYPGNNPLPMQFALDDVPCTAQVSGAASTATTGAQGPGPSEAGTGPPTGLDGGRAGGAGTATGSGNGNGKGNDKAKGKGKGKGSGKNG